jgi:hypothetical protein
MDNLEPICQTPAQSFSVGIITNSDDLQPLQTRRTRYSERDRPGQIGKLQATKIRSCFDDPRWRARLPGYQRANPLRQNSDRLRGKLDTGLRQLIIENMGARNYDVSR